MRVVVPAEPPAPWIGGKRLLAGRIIARLERVVHTTYVEPFAGMGGIFLRRRQAAPSEVINDVSGDVVNLFRILQRHYVQFMDELRFGVTSRAEFQRLLRAEPASLTDLERAARFLYLQRTAFGGKVTGQNFGVSPETPARFDVTKLAQTLADVHDRLSGVVIENLDWRQVIARYDRPGTLFYLDPPYWGSTDDYGRNLFCESDFAEMAALLAGIEGGFMLSINDVPEVRDIFAAFAFEVLETTYTIGEAGAKPVSELLITGGAGLTPLPETPLGF